MGLNDYRAARSFIGTRIEVSIDRPLGSHHPTHGFLYPVNYGCLPGVPAPDGEDLDAYVLGVDQPLERFEGVCIAVIHRLDDDDDKLVVVPEGVEMSDEQIRDTDRVSGTILLIHHLSRSLEIVEHNLNMPHPAVSAARSGVGCPYGETPVGAPFMGAFFQSCF